MKPIEFFNGIEEVCPFQDIQDDEEIYMLMEPSTPLCVLPDSVDCSLQRCQITYSMIRVTSVIRNIYKTGMFEPMIFNKFFSILCSICEFRIPVDNVVINNKQAHICELNNDNYCDDKDCPVVWVMMEYINHLKNKSVSNNNTKTALQKMREKNISNYPKGYTKIKNNEHFQQIKSLPCDVSIKSCAELQPNGLQKCIYYYKKINNTKKV